MRSFPAILPAVTHLQIPMALSAVALVDSMTLLLAGRSAGSSWLFAAGFGTLGLYLLDGIRSSDHEDAISQQGRASLCRRHRGVIALFAFLALLTGGGFLLASGPSDMALCVLAFVALLGTTHVLPLIRWRGRWRTVKELPLIKPVAISFAWLLGGFVVATAMLPEGIGLPAAPAAGLTLMVGPLLLLDSIWLDRRDMRADAAFSRGTLSARLDPRTFLVLRLVLFLTPLAGIPLLPHGVPFLAWSWSGAACLVLLEPDRIRSETLQVLMAALWRFTGCLGLLFVFS